MKEERKVHWFLIRGLCRETRHWGPFLKRLEDDGHKVTPLELPGVGTRKDKSSPLSIQEYVEDLRELFLKTESSGPKVLMGISMGGMIALSWLSKYPEDFDSGIIINSSGGKLSPFYHRLTPAALKTLFNVFLAKNTSSRVKAILQGTTNIVKLDVELLDTWVSFEQEYAASKNSFLRQLISAATFSPPEALGRPVLFIASKKDYFVSYQCSIRLAQHYRQGFLIHPEAGHDLPLDDPKWLADRAGKFANDCLI